MITDVSERPLELIRTVCRVQIRQIVESKWHIWLFSFSNTDFSDESTENNYLSLWSYNLTVSLNITLHNFHLKDTTLDRNTSCSRPWWSQMIRWIVLRDMRYEGKSQSGPLVYLNVNMSISPPCVHTFMYGFKVTCKPGLSCVTEQKEFWRQYFVALTNSSSTVMLKYLFHVPSLRSGSTSEERTDGIHSNLLLFSFKSTNLKWYPHIMQFFLLPLWLQRV